MIKEVKCNRFNVSEEDIIFEELADLIEAADNMAVNFRSHFVPTEIQMKLYDLVNYSQVPQDEPIHVLLYGSVGSGKSVAALSYVLGGLLDHPGAFCLGARRTYQEIEDTIYPNACKFFDQFDIPYNTSKKWYTVFLKNGSMYRMRSAEKTAVGKSDKADALGSTEYSYAILEETDEITEEFARTVSSRMRQKVGVRRKVIFYICNPPSKDHWLYKMFFEDNNPHDPKSAYRVHFMPVSENVKHVGEGYIAGIHRDFADNPALYLRMVRGEFGPNVKGYPIFSSHFKLGLHVAKKDIWKNFDPDLPLYRCWDFGFIHPAIVVFQDDTNIGQIRVFRAILGNKILLDAFADKYISILERDFPNAKWVDICDPAGVQRRDVSEFSSIDILRQKGLRPKFQRSSIEYGINVIAEQLSTILPVRRSRDDPNSAVPAIWIDPSCNELVDSLFYGYCQQKDAPGDDIKPVKDGRYDHIVDAFRYGIIHCRKPKDKRNQKRIPQILATEYETLTNPRSFKAGTYRDISKGDSRYMKEILKQINRPDQGNKQAGYNFSKKNGYYGR